MWQLPGPQVPGWHWNKSTCEWMPSSQGTTEVCGLFRELQMSHFYITKCKLVVVLSLRAFLLCCLSCTEGKIRKGGQLTEPLQPAAIGGGGGPTALGLSGREAGLSDCTRRDLEIASSCPTCSPCVPSCVCKEPRGLEGLCPLIRPLLGFYMQAGRRTAADGFLFGII